MSPTVSIRLGKGLLQYYLAKKQELDQGAIEEGDWNSFGTNPEWSNITIEVPIRRFVSCLVLPCLHVCVCLCLKKKKRHSSQ